MVFKLASSFNSCLRRVECSLVEEVPGGQVLILRRWRHKAKWAEDRSKKSPTQQALTILDAVYGGGVYQKNWKSARLALLSMQKYCAVINNYSANSDKMDSVMRELGALPITDYMRKVRVKKSAATSATSEENMSDQSGSPSDLDVSGGVIIKKLQILSETVSDVSDEHEERPEFVPASRVVPLEDLEDLPPVRSLPTTYNRLPLLRDAELPEIPTYLKVYVFPRGDISRFPGPKSDLSGFGDYYLMDAASLLPVLALGLKHGDRILDLCAAPGGKSVAMLQTMLPGELICNDSSHSRAKRLQRVLKTFCPVESPGMAGVVRTTVHDGVSFNWFEEKRFDKVLVDVPCTIDRISLNVEENNIFTARRAGQRNQLPQVQLDLLMSACRSVEVGGTVVYSTCSLSPIQNDGVVHLAVEELVREDIRMVVMDSEPFVEAFRGIYRFHFGEDTTYGQTVLPHIANNFGPMYFSKLRRLS